MLHVGSVVTAVVKKSVGKTAAVLLTVVIPASPPDPPHHLAQARPRRLKIFITKETAIPEERKCFQLAVSGLSESG